MTDTDILTLRANDGACARVHAEGAHVLSWQPAGDGERLYLSPRSRYGSGAAIRGGIPVIFPQFASEGPLPKHGFARNRRWTLLDAGIDADGAGNGRWQLRDDADTRVLWPHRFEATLSVRVAAASLSVELRIDNRDADPFDFTAALHSYLWVDDIAGATVHGLQGVRYRDAVNDNRRQVEGDAVLRIDGEVDRVYEAAPARVRLCTAGAWLDIVSANLPDTVVWNPGPQRCAALSDMPADGYRQMLCIEAGAIATPVTLAASATWRGSQTLIAVPPA